MVSNLDIVDKGPGADVNGQPGLLYGKHDNMFHALDLTYGACALLGLKYDANHGSFVVTWWIEDALGKPVEMKGLDAPRKYI